MSVMVQITVVVPTGNCAPGKGGSTVIIVDYTCYCAVVACGCRIKGCAHYRVVTLSSIGRVARCRNGTGDRRILIIGHNYIILAGLIVAVDVGDDPDDAVVPTGNWAPARVAVLL